MTDEKLNILQKLKNEIVETEHIVSALQNRYGNIVRAYDYKNKMIGNGESNDVFVNFSIGDELHTIILDYFKNELEKLKKEFENI